MIPKWGPKRLTRIMKLFADNLYAIFSVPLTSVVSIFIAWTRSWGRDALLNLLIFQSIAVLLITIGIFVWFSDHRKMRLKVTAGLVESFLGADMISGFWQARMLKNLTEQDPSKRTIVSLDPDQSLEELRSGVKELLENLTSYVAYRTHPSEKAATFLMPADDSDTSRLVVFAEWHHGKGKVASVVNSNLRMDNSIAGLSIAGNRAILVPNCLEPPKGIVFAITPGKPTYLSKNSFHVPGFSDEPTKSIGAVCVDLKDEHDMNQEDQKVVALYCLAISSLCRKWIEMTGDPLALDRLRKAELR